MAIAQLPVVQVKSLLRGTDAFEAKRSSIVEDLAAKIPESYRLPKDIIDNPPLNVTDIPRNSGILSEDESEITENYDATAIAQAISKGHLTAVNVTTAFCKRAAIAHQLTCCLTDWFMDEALERAKYLDDYQRDNGKTVGPLHGVPISLKEHIGIKGHYASWGYLSTRTFMEEDIQMVRILRDAGAVFYVKTNQPQAVMHLECTSFHGRTLNPHNIGLSAGGSSGGEAALVALRGSVLGIGTDIGGSIRGPAGFCGITGFKPTCYTLPMKDFIPGGFPAELNILASVGPMCTSIRDADLFTRVIKASDPHLEDPRVVPIPWTGLSTSLPLPLKIGITYHDGTIVPQPPVLKAMEWVEKQLASSSQIRLKPYTPYKAARAMSLIRKAYWPDAAAADKKAMAAEGEPMEPLTAWIHKDVEGEDQKNGTQINEMRYIRDKFRSEFAQHWNEHDIDFVITPMFVGPACAHDTAFYWNYTALWNYVDYPGIVLPTPITAGVEKESYPAEYSSPLSKEDEHVRQMWKETDFREAPINIQIVARKHHDNELFGALTVLKDALKFA